jgi:hypothetical protein
LAKARTSVAFSLSQHRSLYPVSANLTETDEPERVETALVGAGYFSMLGVGAQLGRVFETLTGSPASPKWR